MAYKNVLSILLLFPLLIIIINAFVIMNYAQTL
jgi:hypothetical protein